MTGPDRNTHRGLAEDQPTLPLPPVPFSRHAYTARILWDRVHACQAARALCTYFGRFPRPRKKRNTKGSRKWQTRT